MKNNTTTKTTHNNLSTRKVMDQMVIILGLLIAVGGFYSRDIVWFLGA